MHVGIMDKQCVCEKVRITLAYSSEVQRRYFKADCLANHDQQLDFLYYPLADTFRLFHVMGPLIRQECLLVWLEKSLSGCLDTNHFVWSSLYTMTIVHQHFFLRANEVLNQTAVT